MGDAPKGHTPSPAGTHIRPPPLAPLPTSHLAAPVLCCTPVLSGVPVGSPVSHQVPAGSPWSHSISSLYPGYYYDLDDSCDDSDEEEVRAHLRCVAEQPPLKLDTSSEVQLSLRCPLAPLSSPGAALPRASAPSAVAQPLSPAGCKGTS